MPWVDKDTYQFKSGKKIYANRGIIGIDEDLKLSEGYDGGFATWPIPEWWEPNEKAECLQAEDLKEIADLMIERWKKFKKSLDKF